MKSGGRSLLVLCFFMGVGMRIRKTIFVGLTGLMLFDCSAPKTELRKPVQLITVDPGHFHAALVQKSMYAQVDSTVYVYAPGGVDLDLHLNRISAYNTRAESPTHWQEKVYTGSDFLEKMVSEKNGNVVILSGNNKRKTEFITKSLEAGLHVLADKPMVIDPDDFQKLLRAFAIAKKNKVLLYDIMTERFEITTQLQRELSQLSEIFGTLEKGTPQNPAITKESVHHFYKYVSGSALTRPVWFLDVDQQGEGLVDVMTHLVDLVQWECFPNQTLDTTDIQLSAAKRWASPMSLDEFRSITKSETYPDFLQKYVTQDTLNIFCNGTINFSIQGVHARTSVSWKYKAPEGTGDTHYSSMRGTKANLVIRQGAAENFKPALYIEPVLPGPTYEVSLIDQFKTIQNRYTGVELQRKGSGWQVVIPDQYHNGHEAHFGEVTKRFLEYVEQGVLPEWEVPNMITRYYTTIRALQLARVGNNNVPEGF
jgi:predicted dehydrogenase